MIRITEKNLRALRHVFGEATRRPNAGLHISPRYARSLNRCRTAGLLVVEGSDLVLTPEGVAALAPKP